ncbi:hypothetical protein ACWF0M_13820 [Kribbella sp. NPDC055110]
MAEIFQQFGGMMDAAQVYRNLGEERITAAQDQLSSVNALSSGAWCSADHDDYFVNAQLLTNQADAHGMDAKHRATVMDSVVSDGQSTLATCRGIAASLSV